MTEPSLTLRFTQVSSLGASLLGLLGVPLFFLAWAAGRGELTERFDDSSLGLFGLALLAAVVAMGVSALLGRSVTRGPLHAASALLLAVVPAAAGAFTVLVGSTPASTFYLGGLEGIGRASVALAGSSADLTMTLRLSAALLFGASAAALWAAVRASATARSMLGLTAGLGVPLAAWCLSLARGVELKTGVVALAVGVDAAPTLRAVGLQVDALARQERLSLVLAVVCALVVAVALARHARTAGGVGFAVLGVLAMLGVGSAMASERGRWGLLLSQLSSPFEETAFVGVRGYEGGPLPALSVVGDRLQLVEAPYDAWRASFTRPGLTTFPRASLGEAFERLKAGPVQERHARWHLTEGADLTLGVGVDAEAALLREVLEGALGRGMHRVHLFGESGAPLPAGDAQVSALLRRLRLDSSFVPVRLARADDACEGDCAFAALEGDAIVHAGERWPFEGVSAGAAPGWSAPSLRLRAGDEVSPTQLMQAAATAAAQGRLLTLVFDAPADEPSGGATP